MSQFKWNDKEILSTTVYDPRSECELPVLIEFSLKERLEKPLNGKRPGDQLSDIGKGIALIMEHIEKMENDKG